MSNLFKSTIVGSALLSGVAGFMFGSNQPGQSLNITTYQQKPPITALFKSQSATILGKVSTVNGNSLEVVDQKNQKDKFQSSTNLVIFKPTDSIHSQAIKVTDSKLIPLNQDAIIILEPNGTNFEVTSITYLPDSSKFPAPNP